MRGAENTENWETKSFLNLFKPDSGNLGIREPFGTFRSRRSMTRVAEVQETRDFTSEQFRSEIPYPQTSGGRAVTLRPTRFDRRGDDAFQITILVMNKILLRIEISHLAPHVRGGVAVHFPVRRVVPGGGAPVWRDALNCVPPVAAI